MSCYSDFAGLSLFLGGDVASYNNITVPAEGMPIGVKDGKFVVPDNPIIPFIEGDGTGPDIWRASRTVFDAAVARAYGGRRRVAWYEVLAGEKAYREFEDGCPRTRSTPSASSTSPSRARSPRRSAAASAA